MTGRAEALSVLIPARNAERTIADAVLSVVRQSGDQPLEILVVDDRSSDRTTEAATAAGGSAVRLVQGAGRGAAAARNVGLRCARGEWVAFLDADDVWLDGYLPALRRAVGSNRAVGACFGAALHVAPDGTVVNVCTVRQRHATVSGLLTRRLQPTTSATAVRRSIALELGGFDEGFTRPAGVEDIDLWWRIAARAPCAVQPQPLVRYTVHEERDRGRGRDELAALAADRRRCIERLRGEVPDALFRRAAAQHLAIMARYWLLGGERRKARREAMESLQWRATLNGMAALALASLPNVLGESMRQARRAAIRSFRRA